MKIVRTIEIVRTIKYKFISFEDILLLRSKVLDPRGGTGLEKS